MPCLMQCKPLLQLPPPSQINPHYLPTYQRLYSLFAAPYVFGEPDGARFPGSFLHSHIVLRRIRALRLKVGLLNLFPGMSVLQEGLEHNSEDMFTDEVRSVSEHGDKLEIRNVRTSCYGSGGWVAPSLGGNEGILGLVSKQMDAFYAAYTEKIRHLHSLLDKEEDARERTARQTAAGRALWNHVIHDPLAKIMAGESHLKKLQVQIERATETKARETAGVMLAVRTLWFDLKLEGALTDEGSGAIGQVILLGAGMDTRAYRLKCLEDCVVFEVDLPKILDVKRALLSSASEDGREVPRLCARRVERVAADLGSSDWFEKLREAGYEPSRGRTVWVMEGILYYLRDEEARAVLKRIAQSCPARTVVLADVMNELSTQLQTHFHFHSDWPEELLPSLGFDRVRVSQMGDPDANFGLIDDLGFFNALRRIPRYSKADAHGNPCRRLYLVHCSVAAASSSSSSSAAADSPLSSSPSSREPNGGTTAHVDV